MNEEFKKELQEIIFISKNLITKEIYKLDTCKITSALHTLREISIKTPSAREIFGKCPFWTGVDYQGLYECARYRNICYGCDYNSKHWYRRLWFRITTEIDMWYHCSFTFQISKLKAYLFNRQDYKRYFAPYWWDKRRKDES